ncbi:MAG: heme exporter protein CcmB [Firmicutes bacterium]|nr:heme exporter protein CcmB [Bacillota bacterium]
MLRWAGLTWVELTLGVRTRNNGFLVAVMAGLAAVVSSLDRSSHLGGALSNRIGVIWMALLFLGMLETASGLLREELPSRLSLAIGSRLSVFWSKFCAAWMTLAGAAFVLVATTGLARAHVGGALVCVILGITGITAVGTLFYALALTTERAGPVLPVLIVPLELPILICGMETMQALWSGKDPALWIHGMMAFDAIFLALPMLFIDILWEV